MLAEIGINEQKRIDEQKQNDSLLKSLQIRVTEGEATISSLVAQLDALRIEKDILLSANASLNNSYLKLSNLYHAAATVDVFDLI